MEPKIGHACVVCGLGQLFQGNTGLQCPTCHKVFGAHPAPQPAPEPEKVAGRKFKR